MDTKLECEVDVEGTADMQVRREGRGSISSRPISARSAAKGHESTFQACPSSSPPNVEQSDGLNLKS